MSKEEKILEENKEELISLIRECNDNIFILHIKKYYISKLIKRLEEKN